jgi:hypothetical protein
VPNGFGEIVVRAQFQPEHAIFPLPRAEMKMIGTSLNRRSLRNS